MCLINCAASRYWNLLLSGDISFANSYKFGNSFQKETSSTYFCLSPSYFLPLYGSVNLDSIAISDNPVSITTSIFGEWGNRDLSSLISNCSSNLILGSKVRPVIGSTFGVSELIFSITQEGSEDFLDDNPQAYRSGVFSFPCQYWNILTTSAEDECNAFIFANRVLLSLVSFPSPES